MSRREARPWCHVVWRGWKFRCRVRRLPRRGGAAGVTGTDHVRHSAALVPSVPDDPYPTPTATSTLRPNLETHENAQGETRDAHFRRIAQRKRISRPVTQAESMRDAVSRLIAQRKRISLLGGPGLGLGPWARPEAPGRPDSRCDFSSHGAEKTHLAARDPGPRASSRGCAKVITRKPADPQGGCVIAGYPQLSQPPPESARRLGHETFVPPGCSRHRPPFVAYAWGSEVRSRPVSAKLTGSSIGSRWVKTVACSNGARRSLSTCSARSWPSWTLQ